MAFQKEKIFFVKKSMAAGWWRHPRSCSYSKIVATARRRGGGHCGVCVTQDNGVSGVAALMQIVALQGHF